MSSVILGPPKQSPQQTAPPSLPTRQASRQTCSSKSVRVGSLPTIRTCEKRQSPRQDLHCSALLIDHAGAKGSPRTIPAECKNASRSGLFVIVPVGYGVAIGQRYDIQLVMEEPIGGVSAPEIISHTGEIIRASLQFHENGYADRIGIGVRLSDPGDRLR